MKRKEIRRKDGHEKNNESCLRTGKVVEQKDTTKVEILGIDPMNLEKTLCEVDENN